MSVSSARPAALSHRSSREADWLLVNTCYLLSAVLPIQAALTGSTLSDSLFLWASLVGAVIVGVAILTLLIHMGVDSVGAVADCVTWGDLDDSACQRLDEAEARAALRRRLLDLYAPFIIEWAAAGVSADLIACELRRMSCDFAFSGADVQRWIDALLQQEDEQHAAAARRRRLRAIAASNPLPCLHDVIV